MHRYFVAAALFAAVVSLTGCGDAPRSQVRGRITLNGQPLTNCVVMFFGQDKQVYRADLRADGTYTVDGVPRGPIRVAIQQEAPRPAPRPMSGAGVGGKAASAEIAKDDQKGASRMPEPEPEPKLKSFGPPLPAKYAQPDTSGLAFELNEPSQEWSVDLK